MSPEFVENTDRLVETDQSHRVRSYRSNAAGKRFQERKSGCQRTWSSDKPRQKALFFLKMKSIQSLMVNSTYCWNL